MIRFVVAGSAFLLAAAPASAATYVFDVNYNGGGEAFLAAGSDDPRAIVLQAGDQFTYSFSAINGGFWEIVNAQSLFPFFSLGVSNSSVVNYSLSLLNDGTSVFSSSANNATNCCAHMGTNALSLPAGLKYDAYSLSVSILSGGATSTAYSLLPYLNKGPEQQFVNSISFTQGVAAVPEPGTWAMMILGFGVVGAGIRAGRRRPASLAAA